ncbi:hypothetical protein GCM10022252_24320 [Streptosporangium oxazolinicum]|uniref:Uncharacterized protein n=1 Tax=Streptosporangium oxazolinicum TaxID=909287 RepID=A0ABP8ARB1_9ACTN
MGEDDPEVVRAARGGVGGVYPQVVPGSEHYGKRRCERHGSELKECRTPGRASLAPRARPRSAVPATGSGRGAGGCPAGELAHFIAGGVRAIVRIN